jgi:transcriptional regulator with XRE-family HTH domain
MAGWGELIRGFRLRHGLSQARMAALMGVSQRTISRWERGEDNPSLHQQKRLRDLGWEPPGSLLYGLVSSIINCPAPRALSRSQRLTLQALSGPAVAKRPSIRNWIGQDLMPIASGILSQMLDDRGLQRAIGRREVAGIVATTRSVLDTPEAARIGSYRTTITYFFHEGTLYSDAISVSVPEGGKLGYAAIPMDQVGLDSLADRARVEESLTTAERRFRQVGRD